MQMRQLLMVTGMHELHTDLMLKQLHERQAALPPWWPDSVWNEEKDAVEQVDSAVIDLPFYQRCYSEPEARMFIHLWATPDGHTFALGEASREAQRRGLSLSPEQAKAAAIDPNLGVNGAAVRLLDPTDQGVAKAVFTTPRGDEIRTCVAANYAKAVTKIEAQQQAAIDGVVAAHRAQLDAAKGKFEARQIAPTSPSPALPAAPVAAQAEALDGRPITKTQLEAYFDKSMILVASKRHIQDGLTKTRATLPLWVPAAVWDDVKAQVNAIDYVGVLLPVYQHYFTELDGAALVLMLDGPTGHAYAEASLKSRMAAINQGLEGSAAESAAMSSDLEKETVRLEQKRVAELTPEELASVQAVGAKRRKIADGLALDDEQNAVINKKVNDVMHATLHAHNTELAKAQQAYEAKNPGSVKNH